MSGRPPCCATTPDAAAGATARRAAHPLFARFWRVIGPRAVAKADRAALLAALQGRVLEVGAGDGANFLHYPSRVTSVLAVEPEPHLAAHARRAAARASAVITVAEGVAEALPVEDGAFDAAVACLVLCSVGDQHAVLTELRRVLRPGGELRFYEHVVSPKRGAATIQRALDRTGVWPLLGAGCHLARDTASSLAAAGFVIEQRWPLGSGPLPIVAGVARCLA